MAWMWPHLEGIAHHIQPLQDIEVGLLIGYDCPRALAPRDVIPPQKDEPYGQRTDLGWGIVGIIDRSQSECVDDPIGTSHRIIAMENDISYGHGIFSHRTVIKENIDPMTVVKMMELDFCEQQSCEGSLSQDDRLFLNKITEGIHLTEDGRYEMPLPFKGIEPVLPNNLVVAVHRLKQLKRRLAKDPQYHRDYVDFMQNVIDNGYAEPVPETDLHKDNGQTWFIPHHGIYHQKKPGKIRVVFDCSARCGGVSLNDVLLQGPDLTNTLIGVLCRFRMERVALMCDIEQMFYQFRVNPEQRDFLRFLWWTNGDIEQAPVQYRMTVHLFGATSSPGCANFGLKQIAKDNESEYGVETAKFVQKDFYVDDGLKSVPSVSEAVALIDQSRKMCAKGGLRLHKFISNSREVLASIPPEDQAKGLKNLDLSFDPLPMERALGIHRCTSSDTFQFHVTLKERPFTRRGVLSTVSSIFDPLGFHAPIMLSGKRLLQQMCHDNTDWDTPLSVELKSAWEHWRSGLLQIQDIRIPRCLKPEDFGNVVIMELHHFSDASMKGYGQCSYLRQVDDRGRVHCALVMGKSRVAPLRPITETRTHRCCRIRPVQ